MVKVGHRQIFEINVPHTHTDIATDRHTTYPKLSISSHYACPILTILSLVGIEDKTTIESVMAFCASCNRIVTTYS